MGEGGRQKSEKGSLSLSSPVTLAGKPSFRNFWPKPSELSRRLASAGKGPSPCSERPVAHPFLGPRDARKQGYPAEGCFHILQPVLTRSGYQVLMPGGGGGGGEAICCDENESDAKKEKAEAGRRQTNTTRPAVEVLQNYFVVECNIATIKRRCFSVVKLEKLV